MKLAAAVVGLGRWGQTLVRSVQWTSDKIRFIAGVAHSPAKAVEFGAEAGIRITDSFEEVLQDPAVDVVVLASPHSHHHEQIRLAATTRKPVFVEKPLALDGKAARAAVAACSAASIPLCVGHNRRFLPAMRRLQDIVRDELGTVLQYETNFSGSSGLGYHPNAWRADPAESPGGGLTGLGIHMLDAVIALGGTFRSVVAVSSQRVLPVTLDDTLSAVYQLRDGSIATLNTMIATSPCFRLQVYGTKGWVKLEGHHELTLSLIGKQSVTTVFDPLDIEKAELEAFADTVVKGVPYPVSAAQAIHGVDAMQATVVAAEQRTRITVKDCPDDMAT